jgi:nucleotide-binding universal stress UspA family protein
MKKILVVFDGKHFPRALLDFALDMNSKEPILLTGLFLPSVDYSQVMNYLYFGTALPALYLDEYEEDVVSVKTNVALFEAFCNEHNIRHKVHKSVQKDLMEDLSNETRYADLLVVSSADFYDNLGEMIQDEYLDDTLHKAECPVLLLPDTYIDPRNLILTYDGSTSSMHAIRQFIYLFPYWTDLDTMILYVNDSKDEIPSYPLIKEYTAQHFNKLAYYKLDINPKKYFSTWTENQHDAVIVSGAYGRSPISELFHKHFLKDVIKEHKVPLFIAHL